MRIIIDLDDTLSVTRNRDWENAEPIMAAVERVREIREKIPNAEVWIHTSRGMNSCSGDAGKAEAKYRAVIETWLKKYSIVVDGIIFGKPLADLYVDDKAMSAEEFAGSQIEALGGLSGASVTRIGRMIVKEAEDVERQAEWYEAAAAHGFSVPRVYCCQLGKLYMEYAGSTQWSIEPMDIIELTQVIRRFAGIPVEGSNNIERYAWHCHQRAMDAGEDDGDLRERLESCEELREPTFCHGDFSLTNIIRRDNKYTLIDPCQRDFMSHWMIDASKFRASLNWLNYGLTGKRIEWEGAVRVFDAMFTEKELETIKTLEESHYYRVLRYAVHLGRKDVAKRLRDEYGRRER